MNLLCPNCQQMLNVSDEYAGQLMKCPLCSNTFTVPTLGDDGGAPADAAAPAPADAGAPAGDGGSPPPAAENQTFAVQDDPAPPPPPPPPPETPSAPDPAVTEPTTEPTGEPSVPSTEPVPTGDYTTGREVIFSPKVLKFIPAVAVFLIFVVQFFPWVGIYMGGVHVVSQSAWGAAFAGFTPDEDLAGKPDADDNPTKDLKVSVLTLFYILVFIPAFLITIALLVMEFVKIPLPPALNPVLEWKWGIVTALHLVMFLFLGLQLLIGFSLETAAEEKIEKQFSERKPEDTKQRKQLESQKGMIFETIQRTFWLRLAVWLHIFAVLAAAMMFWIGKRGPSKPYPRLVVQW